MADNVSVGTSFNWWFGTVENRNDPLKLGRCQVRVIGEHSGKLNELPVAALPWAHLMLPVNNANVYTPKEGDKVIGFYQDGKNKQQPIIMGVLPNLPLYAPTQTGHHDTRTPAELASAPVKPYENATNYPRNLDEPTTSRLARGASHGSQILESKKKNLSSTFELPTPYRAEYPYNNAIETESGHAIEMDDTLYAERLHFYHRKGSYQEYRPDGSVQAKVVKHSYQAVDENKNVYVKGNYTVNVDGNLLFNVKGSITASAGKSIGLTAGTSFSASAATSASVAGKISGSLSGQALTSVGAIASKTSVSGALTSVSGLVETTVSGGITTVSSKGITTVSGSVVKILGAPVGSAETTAQDAGSELVGSCGPGFETATNLDLLNGIIPEGFPIPTDAVAEQASRAADVVSGVESAIADGTSTIAEIGGQADYPDLISEVNSDTGELQYLDLDGNVVPGDTPVSTTYFPDGTSETTLADGSTQLNDATTLTTEIGQGAQVSQSAFDSVKDSASKVVDAAKTAAGKVDIGDAVAKSAKDAAETLTKPFTDAFSTISKNYDILTSPTAKLSEQWAAAKSILATGVGIYSHAQSIASVSPKELLTKYGLAAAATIGSQYVKKLSNSDAAKELKATLNTTVKSYADDISNKAKEYGTAADNYMQDAKSQIVLNSRQTAAEIAQETIDNRLLYGYTAEESKQTAAAALTIKSQEIVKTYTGSPNLAAAWSEELTGTPV